MGSALFWLQAADCRKRQLNQAVAFHPRDESDDFGRCANEDPGDFAADDCVDVHGETYCVSTLVAF